MEHQRIGIALLGIGRWGNHLLRNFLEHPQAEVRAIADPHPEHLEQAVHRFQLTSDVTVTPRWEEAIATPGIEAVAIATPASTHTALIRAALGRNLHVLAEKPITLEVQEAEELCELAQQRQRCLMVDHTYLFHPVVAAGRNVVQANRLGTLRYGYSSRTHLGPVRPDVDALWDLAIHDIAIFNYWLGDRPCQAAASGTIWLQPNRCLFPLFPQGLADVVWAQITYPSGFQAMIHLCWVNPDKQRRLCIVGSQGTLIFDEMQPNSPLTLMTGHLTQEGQYFQPEGLENQAIALPTAEPLNQVCTHFLQQVRHQSQQETPELGSMFPTDHSNGQVGTDLIRVLTALSQSFNDGGRAIAIEYPVHGAV